MLLFGKKCIVCVSNPFSKLIALGNDADKTITITIVLVLILTLKYALITQSIQGINTPCFLLLRSSFSHTRACSKSKSQKALSETVAISGLTIQMSNNSMSLVLQNAIVMIRTAIVFMASLLMMSAPPLTAQRDIKADLLLFSYSSPHTHTYKQYGLFKRKTRSL